MKKSSKKPDKPSYQKVRVQKVNSDAKVFNPSSGHYLDDEVHEVPHAPYWRRLIKAGSVKLLTGKAVSEELPKVK